MYKMQSSFDYRRWGSLLLVIIYILLIMLAGCRPAKTVARQDADIDELKNKWAAEYIKNNPCPTLPLINLDSLCMGLGFTVYQEEDAYKDSSPKPNDSAAGISSIISGITYISGPKPPRFILVPGPPDTRMIQLLNDSVAALCIQLSYCNGIKQGVKEVYREQSKWAFNNWTWILLVLAGFIILMIIFKLRKKTKP